jgi:hypothetical protein
MTSASQNSTSQNIWECTENFEGDWFLPTSECRMWMMMWCQSPSRTDTIMENSPPWWFLSISTTRVHLLLGYHANYVQLGQRLQPWLYIVHGIVFTDETQFTWDGIIKKRNSRSQAHENPHEVAEFNFQCQFSVNVWCGALSNYLLGHVIKGQWTAPYYTDCLEN